MNVTLDSNSVDFIRHGVATGRFKDASEMIGLALNLLRDQKSRAHFDALRSALEEGIAEADRGELVDLDLPNLIQEIRDDVASG